MDQPSATDYPRTVGRLLLTPEEAVRLKTPGDVTAAVLVPLYVSERRLVAVFTKRVTGLRHHPGQISFPGGRRDPNESLPETALREAEEEIGLRRELVSLVGALPPVSTFVTNYAVYPFVGMIGAGVGFRCNPEEVEAVVELTLESLRTGFERKRLLSRGVPVKTDTYTAHGHMIWGATARILGELLARLEPVVQPGGS